MWTRRTAWRVCFRLPETVPLFYANRAERSPVSVADSDCFQRLLLTTRYAQAQAPEIEKQLKAANIEAGTASADGLEELSKKMREEAAKAEAAQQK